MVREETNFGDIPLLTKWMLPYSLKAFTVNIQFPLDSSRTVHTDKGMMGMTRRAVK